MAIRSKNSQGKEQLNWPPREYTDKQLEAAAIITSPQIARFLLNGGSRSGKTVYSVDFIIDRAIFYPGTKHIILRKTEKAVRDKTWLESVKPTLKKLESAGICRIYASPTRAIIKLPGINPKTGEEFEESHILIGGLAPSEIDGVLGIEYSTVLIDEASEVSYNSVTALYTRMNEHGKFHIITGKEIEPKILFTQNPPTVNHWTYKTWFLGQDPIDGTPILGKDMYATLTINPMDNLKNLSRNYIRELESLSGRARQRFLEGKFGMLTGLVYDNFDPEKHVIDDDYFGPGKKYDPKNATLYRIIDFGYIHPFVCLWVASFPDGTDVYYREYYQKLKTVSYNSVEILRLTGDERIEKTISDHDSEDRATLEECGIDTKAANKNVSTGIDRVRDKLDAGKILFLRSLENLINEMYGYQVKDGSAKEWDVIKLNDDGLDCVRYKTNEEHKEAEFEFFQVKHR